MKWKSLQAVSGWALVFGVNFLFQLYRGNPWDQVIFTLVLIFITLESLHLFDWIPEFRKLRSARLTQVILILISLYLIFAKPASAITGILMPLFLIFMFFALWRKRDGEKVHLKPEEIKSAKVWAIIGVAICLWELIAYVLGSISDDTYSSPTISDLLLPEMGGIFGRAVFTIGWAFIGFLLLRDWREPK